MPCAFFTRQNIVVQPLSHVKRPELLGISQDLAVSQTGYITRQVSDYNFMAHNDSVRNPSSKSVAPCCITGYAIQSMSFKCYRRAVYMWRR